MKLEVHTESNASCKATSRAKTKCTQGARHSVARPLCRSDPLSCVLRELTVTVDFALHDTLAIMSDNKLKRRRGDCDPL